MKGIVAARRCGALGATSAAQEEAHTARSCSRCHANDEHKRRRLLRSMYLYDMGFARYLHSLEARADEDSRMLAHPDDQGSVSAV